ncbi:CPSF A subunit region [Trypanosoma vivax]|nr:CPSF A subunit region [Trypanosoma vivax]
MLIARDTVPRGITSVACLDERTIAASDRCGNVVFLRIPQDARLGLSESLQQLTDSELIEAERYAANEQVLEEVALHHTGQLVTSLRTHDYDPSGGTDTSLALRILFYATSLGTIGAYTPFVSEEDATLGAHLQVLVAKHVSCPLHGGSGHPPYNIAGRLSMAPATFTSRVHNVVEGDYAQQLLHTSTTLFSKESRSELESEVGRRERTEGAQRNVLGLPKRSWPTLAELVAKQRALVALPP